MVVLEGPLRLSSSMLHKVRLIVINYTEQCFLLILVETGRWPEKSVKFITRLLKNAESNADAKSLELEQLFIKNIVVQQAPVRVLNYPHPFIRILIIRSTHHYRKPAAAHTAHTVASTRTRATRATSRSFSA